MASKLKIKESCATPRRRRRRQGDATLERIRRLTRGRRTSAAVPALRNLFANQRRRFQQAAAATAKAGV
jgi:hypothetical protein